MFHDVLCLIKSSIFHFSHIFRYLGTGFVKFSAIVSIKQGTGSKDRRNKYTCTCTMKSSSVYMFLFILQKIDLSSSNIIFTCTLYLYLMTRKSYICTSYWSKKFRWMTWELQYRTCKKKKRLHFTAHKILR